MRDRSCNDFPPSSRELLWSETLDKVRCKTLRYSKIREGNKKRSLTVLWALEPISHNSCRLRSSWSVQAAAEVEERVSDPEPISAEITAYLGSNPRTHFVEVICYGLVSVSHRKSVKDWLASCFAPRIPSISIDVVQGEEWNHSVYQAAVQTEDTLYVILVLQKYCCEVEGVSKGGIYGNIRMLQAIARATYETLRAKALYFRVGNSFSVAALTDIAGRTNLAHRCFE